MMSGLLDDLYQYSEELEAVLRKTRTYEDIGTRAAAYAYDVFPAMQKLREAVDKTEIHCAKEYWPYPTYGEMLFSV